MKKYSVMLLIGLISSFCLNMHSYIDPKIKNAVRTSNPNSLMRLLNVNKLTKDESRDLLEIAEQVFTLKKAKVERSSNKLKKIIMKYGKLCLTGTSCSLFTLFGIMGYVGAGDIYRRNLENARQQALIALGASIGCGIGFVVSGIYSLRLLYKIYSSKTKQEKYLDATEVRQILSRAVGG